MTDYKTMRVPEEDFKRAKADKEDRGVTWGEYLTLPCDNAVEGDADTPDVSEQLDRIEAAAREATQAAQNAESAINEVTQR